MVHRRLDIVFTPCVPVQTNAENSHLSDTMCLADYGNKTDLERKRLESVAYLGEPNFVIMTNKETIDITQFGKKSFKYESHLLN